MKYSVVDAHCDTISELLLANQSLNKNNFSVSIEKMKSNRAHIQFFAAFIEKEYKNPLSRATALFEKFYSEIDKNPEIVQVKSYEDAKGVIDNDVCGALLAIEDARVLCGELHNVSTLYRLGVRAMTLAWNDDNDVTDGILSERGVGLSDFGIRVLHRMNEIHMIVDVSHITVKGFWDVLTISDAPVMASHSNAAAICPHPRNLNDEQILALINSGGMIGINLYPLFLNGTRKASIADILKHIEHILSLGGEDNIGIGSDFDGIDYTCDDLTGTDKLHIIFDKMSQIGYSNELINKISYMNFLSFLKNTL